ncbi:hypothetical protein [Laspinema palackyanum]|uniref:hypothetical protein n=1 Tax=Laspinema palackyanum TaxID=3231601 RepID=UPI00345C9E82|nr:hypothetical protein [Laspinema sp. D2c]
MTQNNVHFSCHVFVRDRGDGEDGEDVCSNDFSRFLVTWREPSNALISGGSSSSEAAARPLDCSCDGLRHHTIATTASRYYKLPHPPPLDGGPPHLPHLLNNKACTPSMSVGHFLVG